MAGRDHGRAPCPGSSPSAGTRPPHLCVPVLPRRWGRLDSLQAPWPTWLLSPETLKQKLRLQTKGCLPSSLAGDAPWLWARARPRPPAQSASGLQLPGRIPRSRASRRAWPGSLTSDQLPTCGRGAGGVRTGSGQGRASCRGVQGGLDAGWAFMKWTQSWELAGVLGADPEPDVLGAKMRLSLADVEAPAAVSLHPRPSAPPSCNPQGPGALAPLPLCDPTSHIQAAVTGRLGATPAMSEQCPPKQCPLPAWPYPHSGQPLFPCFPTGLPFFLHCVSLRGARPCGMR